MRDRCAVAIQGGQKNRELSRLAPVPQVIDQARFFERNRSQLGHLLLMHVFIACGFGLFSSRNFCRFSDFHRFKARLNIEVNKRDAETSINSVGVPCLAEVCTPRRGIVQT